MSIYTGGQTINCVFVRPSTATRRCATSKFGRIILRVDRIDAIALS